jgi:CzcA family heavy metal efflux pump
LPATTVITVERLTTTSFPVLTYDLTGTLDPRRLRELGEFVIKPAFSRVRGVGRVEVLSGDVREIEVIVDPERCAALRLDITQIAEKLRAQTVLRAVGRLEQAHALVIVTASGEATNLDELRATAIALGADGSPITLAAVAEVREGAEDRSLRVAGPGGETVLMSIARLPGASTPDVVKAVEAEARALASVLPRGVALTPVYDQAALVDDAMRSVRDAILIGCALCVLTIGLFLRDWRAGAAASLAVPLTLGASFLPMSALGESLNLMSLGGLAVAIGLVIDDAIVMVEAIGRAIERGAPPPMAAAEASRRMFAPLLGTTATTVVVFLPLAWLEGVVGKFFAALAATLSSAVIVSLLVSLSVVPIASAQWLRSRSRVVAPPTARYALLYERMMRWSNDRAWLALSVTGLLAALGVVSALHVPTGFLPELDEGAFVLDYFLPAGTSLTDTDQTARKIERILSHTSDIRTYSRRTGAELGPAAATEVNRGDIMVRLAAARVRPIEDVIADLRAQLKHEVPEARTEFVQVLQDVLNDFAGTPRPIEIKLFGDDYAVLRAKAHEVVARIRDVDGLVDLYEGFEGKAPELRFRIDGAAAARLGKSAQQIADELDAALHGVVAAILRRPDRPIGVRVRYPDRVRFDGPRLAQLPLLVGQRDITRISALATPEIIASETQLLRESLRPVVVVSADRERRDLGSIADEIRRRLRGLILPEGYRLELGGQYEGQRATLGDFTFVMLLGSVAVALVLLAQFRRARLALAVLLTAPLSIVGALVTLWITAIPLNASSLMGCVLLIGLVVKNGILLLEQYESSLEQGSDRASALLEAGRVRVRPILMTTLATIAGLSPLAFGLGAGAELQRPLAVAVIGGLTVSSFVTLLVLPAMVRRLGSQRLRAYSRGQ